MAGARALLTHMIIVVEPRILSSTMAKAFVLSPTARGSCLILLFRLGMWHSSSSSAGSSPENAYGISVSKRAWADRVMFQAKGKRGTRDQ